MPLVNEKTREINAKIVYFGPPASGKRTTLEQIFSKLKPGMRGKLKTIPAGSDRVLAFDFLPGAKSEVDGYTLRIHLYTVHGDTPARGAWKSVLKGADGVVFSADSDPARAQDNLQALKTLEDLLDGTGSSLAEIPAVFQYNRRDLRDAADMSVLQQALNRYNFPAFPTTSASAEGIMAPLSSLVKMITSRLPVPAESAEAPAEEPATASFAAPPPLPEAAEPAVDIEVGTPSAEGCTVTIPLTVRTSSGSSTVTVTVSVKADS